jgi:hypothetical protein
MKRYSFVASLALAFVVVLGLAGPVPASPPKSRTAGWARPL